MKTPASIVLCMAMFYSAAFSEDKAPPIQSGVTSTSEIAEGQVLKVYSGKDGEHQFIAYVVKWKDNEVIVSDPLAKSDLSVGDTIRFMVVKTHIKNGNPEFILSFQWFPPVPKLPQRPPLIPPPQLKPAAPNVGLN